jgi:hypothetical protein
LNKAKTIFETRTLPLCLAWREFFAVLVLNIFFSAAKLLLSVLEILLKTNVLAGHTGRHGRSNTSLLARASQFLHVNPIVKTKVGRLSFSLANPPSQPSSEVLEVTVQSPMATDAQPADDIPVRSSAAPL